LGMIMIANDGHRGTLFACLFYTNVPYAGIDFNYVGLGRGQLTIKFPSLYFTISTEVRPSS
jgi:hypothetical protein